MRVLLALLLVLVSEDSRLPATSHASSEEEIRPDAAS